MHIDRGNSFHFSQFRFPHVGRRSTRSSVVPFRSEVESLLARKKRASDGFHGVGVRLPYTFSIHISVEIGQTCARRKIKFGESRVTIGKSYIDLESYPHIITPKWNRAAVTIDCSSGVLLFIEQHLLDSSPTIRPTLPPGSASSRRERHPSKLSLFIVSIKNYADAVSFHFVYYCSFIPSLSVAPLLSGSALVRRRRERRRGRRRSGGRKMENKTRNEQLKR